MGKYIRNHKTHKEPNPLMEVSSSGVLTRAKSLALQQKQQKPSSSSLPISPNPPRTRTQKQRPKKTTTDCLSVGGGSYLQLRSRRLQKKPPIVLIRGKRRKETCVGQIRDGSKSDSVSESGKVKKVDLCIETSFGENFSNESLNRTTRESTPCSLIRKVETVTTPGSSSKVISDESNQRLSNRHLPTTPEMDEFFSGAEEEQQKQFIEKYNFDPVNEQPLPGRYEWKKVDD